MSKKQKGHYCYGCGENLSNEKFSGKGHKQHICKECKKEGIHKIEQASSHEKHNEHYYMKKVKNILHLFHQNEVFLLFEYEGRKYIMETEHDFDIFQYQTGLEPPFLKAEEFEESSNIRTALFIKQEGSDLIDSIEYLDSYEGLDGIEPPLSKKQKRFIGVVLAIEKESHIDKL